MPEPSHSTDSILESISDGVFTVDAQWRVTSFNRAAEVITGIPRTEALGRRCSEVFRSSLCEIACPLRQTLGQPQGCGPSPGHPPQHLVSPHAQSWDQGPCARWAPAIAIATLGDLYVLAPGSADLQIGHCQHRTCVTSPSSSAST